MAQIGPEAAAMEGGRGIPAAPVYKNALDGEDVLSEQDLEKSRKVPAPPATAYMKTSDYRRVREARKEK